MPDYDKRIVNVDTDESQSSEVARAFGHKGEMSAYTWMDEATGTGMPWPPSEPAPGCMDAPPLVPTPEAVERWGRFWWLWEPGYSEPQIVYIGGHSEYPLHILPVGSDAEDDIDGAGEWLGPVLERPVKP